MFEVRTELGKWETRWEGVFLRDIVLFWSFELYECIIYLENNM